MAAIGQQNFLALTFAAIILRGRLAIARGQFVTNQLSEFAHCFNPPFRRTSSLLFITGAGRCGRESWTNRTPWFIAIRHLRLRIQQLLVIRVGYFSLLRAGFQFLSRWSIINW